MTDTTIPTSHGDMPAYVARPAGSGPWPGVAIISDVFGMTRDLRAQAEWLAGEGFLALAPDLFYWGGKITCLRTIFRDMLSRKGRTFDEIDAVRVWLTKQPACTGKVGVIGFCMGGGFALVLAPRHGFAASSVNYGMIPKDVDAVLAGACPVIGSFGAKDRSLRGAAAKLEQALAKNDVPHDVREYADAGHSFLNEHRDGDISLLMRVMAKLGGSAYHEPSARDARQRITAFFREHLAQESAHETGSKRRQPP